MVYTMSPRNAPMTNSHSRSAALRKSAFPFCTAVGCRRVGAPDALFHIHGNAAAQGIGSRLQFLVQLFQRRDAVCFSRRRFWNSESSELPSGIQTHPPREGRYRAILGEWRKSPPAISSRMPAVNSRRADNCSILGIPFCAKIVLHPVDVPGTNCNVPQGLSHCSGRHWCIQRHQKQCRPHLVGNIVFRHTTAFFFCRRPADE